MSKNKDNSWKKFAGGGAAVGGTAGLIKGGAIGVAAFGGAVGIPLVVAGAGVGVLAGLGAKVIADLCDEDENNDEENNKDEKKE